ncbi:MAG: hypothetical protein ACXW1W_18445 [Methylococcaceae bacterium]
MNEIYGAQHRALQQAFDTEQLADRVKDIIVLRLGQKSRRSC